MKARSVVVEPAAPLASTLATLVANLARLVAAHRVVCGDLTAISRSPDLSLPERAELDDLAGDLGVLVLMLRELSGRVDAWVAARDTHGGVTDQVTG